jgi:hypothetical protein
MLHQIKIGLKKAIDRNKKYPALDDPGDNIAAKGEIAGGICVNGPEVGMDYGMTASVVSLEIPPYPLCQRGNGEDFHASLFPSLGMDVSVGKFLRNVLTEERLV